MTRRPHNGRLRGYHSFAGAIGVGIAILAMAFLGSFIFVPIARSQVGPCTPWVELRKYLKDTFGEEPVSHGVVTSSVLVTVLASPEGKTFSVVMITSQGMACYLATGTDWQPELDRGF